MGRVRLQPVIQMVLRGFPLEMAEALVELIKLQRIDSGMDELDKLKKNFLRDIEALNGEVSIAKNQLAEAKKKQEELSKTRRGFELEVGTLDSKIKKYTLQQNDVKSGEQATALGHEIDKAKAEKAAAEEKILELMMGDDDQKVKIQTLTQALADAEKKAEASKVELNAKIADCDKAHADKAEDRKKQLPLVDEVHARVYESLRKGGKKIAVAEVGEDETCGGCKMNVAPQTLNQIRKKLAIEFCACGRYLYLKD